MLKINVLGGCIKDKFEHKSDLYFHSCGMDKRPSSLFGVLLLILNFNKIFNEVYTNLINLESVSSNFGQNYLILLY